MKTFARLIRRYVLATAGIILVVVALLLGMTIYAGVRYNGASDSVQKVGALAEALHPTADGLQWDAAHTPAEWMHGYAWAMVLDEDGNVIWQQDLPEALNHRYTASDIAVFSRWYLADYPVQCWAADYGLFVAAEPVNSQWKYNITTPQARMEAMIGGLLPVAVLLLGYGYWEQQGLFTPDYEKVQQIWYQDAAFMAEVEDAAGEGAMLFTLPYMKNFENGSLNNMWDYTLLRGPLHSKTLKFSYGAGYGTENDNWYKATSELEPEAMVAELRAQGMAGIYLDLDGYTEEEQQPTLQALINAAGCDESDVIISEGGTLCYIPLGKG